MKLSTIQDNSISVDMLLPKYTTSDKQVLSGSGKVISKSESLGYQGYLVSKVSGTTILKFFLLKVIRIKSQLITISRQRY